MRRHPFRIQLVSSGLVLALFLPSPAFCLKQQEVTESSTLAHLSTGLEEVTVEVARQADPETALRLAREIRRLRGKPSVAKIQRALQGLVPERTYVSARRERAVVGYGLLRRYPVDPSEIWLADLKVDEGHQEQGVATRIFQKGLWWVLEQSPDTKRIRFDDGTLLGWTARIGRKFGFQYDSGGFYTKDLSRSDKLLKEAVSFSAASDFEESCLSQHEDRLKSQRQKIEEFLQRPVVQVKTARLDLTRVPVYVQGGELYGLVRRHLPEMIKGVAFYPILVPDPESPDWETFQWGNFGVVLKNTKLPEISNKPEYLRQIKVEPTKKAVEDLNPEVLLALIYRNILDVPQDAQDVRVILFIDADGNARLILTYV